MVITHIAHDRVLECALVNNRPDFRAVEFKMSSLTREDRAELGRMVVNLLDDWGFAAAHQVSILGLPEGTRTRMLRRYQDDTP